MAKKTTEHSAHYAQVKGYYARKRWDIKKVHKAVECKWITAEEYKEITGEEYVEE